MLSPDSMWRFSKASTARLRDFRVRFMTCWPRLGIRLAITFILELGLCRSFARQEPGSRDCDNVIAQILIADSGKSTASSWLQKGGTQDPPSRHLATPLTVIAAILLLIISDQFVESHY